jgi:NAD(P)-dependent dehydrogenase (short-subunit alcohol dehydrogenase family)
LDGFAATVEHWEDPESLDDESATAAAASIASRLTKLDAAVIDAASVFAGGGAQRLAAALDSSWTLARAVATGAMIDNGGGSIILIAPSLDAGPAAAAAADGIENMARALAVEWARFDLRVVAVCPRAGLDQAELRLLVAWLCSGSGTYMSGCRLEPGQL